MTMFYLQLQSSCLKLSQFSAERTVTDDGICMCNVLYVECMFESEEYVHGSQWSVVTFR